MSTKKKKNEEVIEEVEQEIDLYEIDERYGITPDGVVYDLEKETALVPVLDDIGRPCVKINRKRIPIDDLKRKYLPDEIRDDIEAEISAKSNKQIINKLTNFKIDGVKYSDIFKASESLGIAPNVIRSYLLKGGK